jgi:hypothetical protein
VTEDEFHRCTEPWRMVGFLHANGWGGERRCRLYACACVRRVWPLLPGAGPRDAVEAAEQFADGAIDTDGLAAALAGMGLSRRRGFAAAAGHAAWYAAYDNAAAARVSPAYGGGRQPYGWTVAARAAKHAVDAAVLRAAACGPPAVTKAGHRMRAATQAERQGQATVLRDLFGPLPFRPTSIPTPVLAWNAGCVVKLTTGIYEERKLPEGTLDSGRLAVLADALEEAGLDDQGVLGHLREQGGRHYRGCWCVDVVLGKR